ncbi:SusC/RagA family TonB-linked outer membrane protein [Agriterribacter sp.]|uniref:SusC/RagA family TonB-linked outer membrane protein n=1 Tax=Agriterribacter sp. TaxID=2821509 RepID=UPI002C869E2C|nr:SusC/RagA family TonB-linked outer membrane protein [Agriterribacter sp.]HRO45395.1 SusC/RagA family TonB-linked outer membrane protein [Agriterribacter sp.]HRQ16913.1 SusC/RagA family TonB-linked outer membrane protein [Agriterribacter sp.]
MKKSATRFLLMGMLFLCSAFTFGQGTKTITGLVRDASGAVLPGVSVTEKGSNTGGTFTNENGRFSINAAENAVLVFSYVGYATQEVRIGSNADIVVELAASENALTEVVVTAMGIKKEQRKLGYAVSTVSSKDILLTSPTNFASALYGKAPGVNINTNPGGATSAVSVGIRGLNSINFSRQPLLVVDGVVTRNGEANNDGFWSSPRINGNGLLDINPENIESLTILKGAAASALYGSDAANGVIVITTKNGKGKKGLGVDFNSSYISETVAIVPDLQNEYGPGYDRGTNMGSFGSDDAGWLQTTVNGQTVKYPIFRAYGQFGPKFTGEDVYWWDGEMRPYVAQKNYWNSFYRDGMSAVQNIAVSNATDQFNYRLSYTRNDYKGIQIGGKQEKNTFNLNTSFKITPKFSTDLIISYVNEKVHNRPYQIDRLTNNYGGFLSAAERMDVIFDKYKTTKGYKYVPFNDVSKDPAEALKYNIRGYDFLDFLWNQLENSFDETSNRLMASATVNYDIVRNLRFRGRLGTDYTGYFAESKNKANYPLAFGESGYYGTNFNKYNFTYGDLLLTYSNNVTDKLTLNVSAGYQAREEVYHNSGQGTRDGLTQENWFSFNASKTTPTSGSSSRSFLVKDGLFGILGVEYNNFLFLEGTVRRERTSTLYPGNNTFVYPAVSGSFELSNALTLPQFVSYSKLRASWGVVGNPAPAYVANTIYNAGSINGVATLYPGNPYGNNNLKNERKTEMEFGWETKLLNNRLGFDVSYYNNKVTDQILSLTVPATTGSTGILVNVGSLRNYGVELALYGSPVKGRNFQWDTRLNLAFNRNKVLSLMEGLERLTNSNLDNGSLLIVSEIGKQAGDIIGYKRRQDANGDYVINGDGYYDINFDDQTKMGNIQAKSLGGLTNTLMYKNFALNFLVDFRWGGQVISQALLYGTGAGMYTNSLFGRDKSHGGISYYVDGTGTYVKVEGNATAGPNGEKVYDDGMILKGAKQSDGKENDVIIDAPNYYLNTYAWGSWPGSGSYSTYEGAVFDNNFIKLRELALSYSLPVKAMERIKMQNVTISIYGRNLFYFYKSLPYLDPEESIGTNSFSQAFAGGASAATRSIGASIRVSF